MFKLVGLAVVLAAAPSYAAPPDGCYQLGALVPKSFDKGFTSADASANHVMPIGREICIESKNAKASKKDLLWTGDFTIRIRKGTTTVAQYAAKAMMTDGSGSHDDYVFASEAVLNGIGNADAYARGNRGPIENTIFVILTNDTKTGPVKRKAGDYAGTVTIGDLKYALLVK